MPSVVDPLRIVDGQNVLKGDLREFYGGSAGELNAGGFLQAISAGALERVAQTKYRDFRDSRDFNGDDRTRIQRALDAAGQNEFGGAVYLPSDGHFIGSPGLTIPSRVFLIGDGRSSCIVRAGGYEGDLIRGDPTGELMGVANISVFGSRQGNLINASAIDFDLEDDDDILGDSVWGLTNSRFLITNIYVNRYAGRSVRAAGAGGGMIHSVFANQPGHNGFDILADDMLCVDLKILGGRAVGIFVTGNGCKFISCKPAITGINDQVNGGIARGVGLYCSGDRCTIESTYCQDGNNSGFVFENGDGHNVAVYGDAQGQANSLSAGKPRRDKPYINNTLSVCHVRGCSNGIFHVGARDRGARNGTNTGEWDEFPPAVLNGGAVIDGSSSCQIYLTCEDEALAPDGGHSYPTYGPNTSAQTGTQFTGPGSRSTNGLKFGSGNSNLSFIATRRGASVFSSF